MTFMSFLSLLWPKACCLSLKAQSFFALQSNSGLDYPCNYVFTGDESHLYILPALLVSWLSFHCLIFFSLLVDNSIAFKWSCTDSGSIVDLFKLWIPWVFWGMGISQCIWVSLQSYWKFLRTTVLIAVVEVFMVSPFLSAFRQIFVSEHRWSWAGLAVQPWCPPFPCLWWCAPGRSLAVIQVCWAWTDDSACACQVLWRFCDNIPSVLGSLLAACICSCISK